MEKNLKNWYTEEYTTDELGEELNENITLNDVYDCLTQGKSVYDLIGVGDSLVRERIFIGLSDALNCDYDDIYMLWRKAQD